MLWTAAYTKTINLIWKLIEKIINLRLPGQGIQYARCPPPHFVPWKACENCYFQVKVPFDNFYSKFAISQLKKTIFPPNNLKSGSTKLSKETSILCAFDKIASFSHFRKIWSFCLSTPKWVWKQFLGIVGVRKRGIVQIYNFTRSHWAVQLGSLRKSHVASGCFFFNLKYERKLIIIPEIKWKLTISSLFIKMKFVDIANTQRNIRFRSAYLPTSVGRWKFWSLPHEKTQHVTSIPLFHKTNTKISWLLLQ